MERFDRRKLKILPLSERESYLDIEKIAVAEDYPPASLGDREAAQIAATAKSIRQARSKKRPVMLTYGAHLIKNGLAPLVAKMAESGWITHLATNGAGSIHDWEFAYMGKSSEDVRTYVAQGQFGIWEETGKFINLALAVGGTEGLGYGQAVGRMINQDGLDIPSPGRLQGLMKGALEGKQSKKRLTAWADLLSLVEDFSLPAGRMEIKHTHKKFSLQAAAERLGVPLTVHPGIGYDIIYTHPLNSGAVVGRAAGLDFLAFAESVSRLAGGVHIAVGSAVMAPMIFEKAMSMANNLAIQKSGKPIGDHFLVVNDIQEGGDWDWKKGEPPLDNPAYYLRFCKSFHRMGGALEYVCLDNREFLLALYNELEKK